MRRNASQDLIGRTEVLAGLTEALAEVAVGHGRVVLLSGPAGIGKTRLVAEAADRAVDAGFLVAAGHCDEADRSLPFAPIAGLLRSGPPLPVGATPELAALLPELGTSGPLPPFDTASLVRAVARGLASQAIDVPLLAIVEDLHWSDESSLAALSLVARRAERVPMLLLLTARPDDGAPELSGLLATLDRLDHASEWPLAPLSLEETSTLVARLMDSERNPPAALSARIHLITDGNPLFVEEVVGALALDNPGEFPRAADVDRIPVPRSVQAAVWQRTRTLTPPARRLLQLAAIAGRQPDVNVLAEVAQVDEPALVALLRELLATNLVVEESADRIAFRHELTRRAVASDVLARERRSLHVIVAESLERRHGRDGPAAAELARLFWEAEIWPKCRDHAITAGRHALGLGAPRAAVELLTTAIEAAARLGDPPPIDALAARAAAHERLGEFELAVADLEARLQLARVDGGPEPEGAALLDLGTLWTARDYAKAGDYFRRALGAVRSAPALNRVGSWHLNSERPDQARRHHLEALELYRAAGDEGGMAATFDFLATVALTVGDLAGASAFYDDAISRLRGVDAPALASALAMRTFTVPQYLAWPATWAACRAAAAALAAGEESVSHCRSMGWGSGEALGHVALASVLGEHGRYGEALEHARAAMELAVDAGHVYWMLLAHLILGAIHLDLLAVEEARRELEVSFELAGDVGSDYWRRTACGFLVDACLLAGDRAAARAAIEAVPTGETLDAAPSLTMGLRHLWRGRAELALAEGDHPTATHIVDRLAAVIGRTGRPGERFELLRGRAQAAAGHRAEAEQTWRHALLEAERGELLPVAWRLHAELGRYLRAARRLDEADEHLSAARRQVGRLAATVPDGQAGAAFVSAAGAGLPQPTSRRMAKQTFAGLTSREQEVAALVAEGLTNPEIAARLFLSRRTVEKHVEHILAKLQLATRAQIATWAVRIGLAGDRKGT